jgi:signal transduction histidine kinase/CheY-like chemotaxis protein
VLVEGRLTGRAQGIMEASRAKGTRTLALLLVAALVPLIVFAVATTFLSLQDKRTALEHEALAQARRISAIVDAEILAQLHLLEALARSPLLDPPADIAAFERQLRREQAAEPLWLAGLLADPDGNLLIDTQLPLPGKVVDLAGLREVVERRQAAVGTVVRGKTAAAVPLRAPVVQDGVVRYVVTAAISTDGIRDRLLAADLPADWTGTVVDSAGLVVARTRGDSSLIGKPASAAALEARKAGSSGIYAGRLLEGVPTVSTFQLSPATGWSVHIGIPRAIFDAPLVRALWLAAAGGGASLLLAGLFLLLLVRELRARRAAADALEQARRMEGLGRLTGGVAHDFNNLLSVIMGSIDMLERRLPDARNHRLVTAIRTATERGVEITRSLLAFSRTGTADLTVVDVNACIREMLGLVREAGGAGVTVELALAENLPAVALDRVQLDLALLNLARNARDAMSGQGTLRISTGPEIMPDGTRGVAVTVADDGAGMPAEVRRRAFEPFFTTKEVGRGTGLGLTQVYGFVKSVGGSARIDSHPGEGTRITLAMPATGAQFSEAPAPTRQQTAMAAAQRLLVVDDNRDVREVTSAHLRDQGHLVYEADDGAMAVAILTASRFDAVVSDIVMPGSIDGVALAREIRTRWPGTAILLVTGYAETAAAAAAADIDVLAKPFSHEALAEALALAMGRVQVPR